MSLNGGHDTQVFGAFWGLVFCFVGVRAFAGGSSEGIEFADIQQVDRETLQSRYARYSPEPIGGLEVSASPRVLGSLEEVDVFVARSRIAIDPKALLLHTRTAEPGVVQRPPVFRLTVGGRTLDLAVVDYVFDPSFDLFHLAALLLDGDGKARFTVSEDGTAVVGTVWLDDSVYRIRPAASGTGQEVFEILPGREGQYLAVDAASGVSDIEARHVQMAMIADLQPRVFGTSEHGDVTHVADAPMGRISVWSTFDSSRGAVVVDKSRMRGEVEAFVRKLAPITRFHGPLTLEIESIAGDEPAKSDRVSIRYHQIIDGVPVAESGRLRVDPTTGEVIGFVGQFFEPSAIANTAAQQLGKNEVLTRAQDVIAAKSGMTGNVTVLESRFEYLPAGDRQLRPTWFFQIHVNDTSFFVRVDALTGEGTVLPGGVTP